MGNNKIHAPNKPYRGPCEVPDKDEDIEMVPAKEPEPVEIPKETPVEVEHE